MIDKNDFAFDDVFSDIYDSVYGNQEKNDLRQKEELTSENESQTVSTAKQRTVESQESDSVNTAVVGNISESQSDFTNGKSTIPLRSRSISRQGQAAEMFDGKRLRTENVRSDVSSNRMQDESFDPRFHLNSKRSNTSRRDFSYGGHRVSSSQEADYTPNTNPAYKELQSSYAENEEYELDRKLGLLKDEEHQNQTTGLKKLFRRRTKEQAEEINEKYGKEKSTLSKESSGSESPRPERKMPRISFHSKRNETMAANVSVDSAEEDAYLPATSFKEYATSRLASVMLKLRGGVPADGVTGSVNSNEEFLGDELTPKAAVEYYSSFIKSLRIRTRISLILCLISVYLSLGAPAPGMLSSLKVATAACLAIEFTVLILALDIVTNAVTNCFRGIIGFEALAVFSAVISSVDALTVINTSGVTAHMPFCSISTITITGILFSSLLSARSMRKALRVPEIGKKKYSVTTEMNITGREITALKSTRPITGFLRRLEEAPADEIIYRKASIAIAAAALIFSLLAAIFKRSLSRILYIYSATLCAAVPFSALICFGLPFFMGSLRIFKNGGALAGWSGIADLGHSRNLVVTDTDVFPAECIEIENVRIFADYDAERVITYAGSLICAAGCGSEAVFAQLMEENKCKPVKIDNLTFLAGGGIKGMADGNVIIAGGADLMRLMNIRVPLRLVSQTSVLLSINGILYGIFNMKYTADPKVRKALVSLMKSSRHPVFAIRDFNVTPEMLREHFDVATDGYDFPPYSDRFRISEAKPSGNSQISAIVCREGLGPLTDVTDTARKIYIVSIINCGISLAGSIVGILYAFICVLTSGAVSVGSLLLFTLFFNAPILILGFLTNSFE